MEEGKKRCRKCGDIKPIEGFSKDSKNKDGYNSVCKVCIAKKRRFWVQREKIVLEEKKCGKCKEIKSVEEFGISSYSRDGHRTECLSCRRSTHYLPDKTLIVKRCSKCQIVKLISEFGKNSTNKDGYRCCCKSCSKKEFDLYKVTEEGISRLKETYKYSDLKRKHGLTREMYETLLRERGGRCEICGRSFVGREPFIDHNHDGGVRRGLLCQSCNSLLGQVDDNIEILNSGIKYLKRFQNLNPR